MASSRWLKAVPSSNATIEAAAVPPPSSNVSMSDLRRIQDEKRKRDEAEAALVEESTTERLPVESSQPAQSSQPTVSSQLSGQPRGGPESNQPTVGSQPAASNQANSSLNILASLPDVKGNARLPHKYTDHLCRLLNPYEQAVFLQLYRLSHGWGKDTCFISNPRLSERSNVPLSTMKRTVVGLMNKSLIEKTGHTNGYGKDQGVEYRVLSMGWQPVESSQPAQSWQPAAGTNKINTQKENTQTQSGGVGVESKFTLEECRKYADHLQRSGQGINNPGGYATTIHRTGEADALIEAFLNPEPAAPAMDISGCQDCKGSGFYYPNGQSGGVAKCKHDKLTKQAKK